MLRRDFLSLAAGGTAYSLLVRVRCAPRPRPAAIATPSAECRRHSRRAGPHRPALAISPSAPAERNMKLVELAADVLVAGGGLAGVCTAVAAAREGARVVLVQDRSRLGGNSSSEIKMHVVGANGHTGRPGWREGGLDRRIPARRRGRQSAALVGAVGPAALRQSASASRT